MRQLFTYLSYLQFPLFIIAMYFYLRPVWDAEHLIHSLNKGLLFTGVALSFVSLMPSRKRLPRKVKIILLSVLLPSTLYMFSLSAYWLFTAAVVPDFASSLMVLAIGMLSIIKMVMDY